MMERTAEHFTVEDFLKIPQEMRDIAQWVAWRAEARDGKTTKIPINIATGRGAKTNDPATWASFDDAISYWDEGAGASGVGFVFSEDAGLVGVDLDNCADEESGKLNDEALEILGELKTYSEMSQSRRGAHAILRGALPDGCRHRRGGLEVYDRGRFFVMTGWQIRRYGLDIANGGEAVGSLLRRLEGTGDTRGQQVRPAASARTQERYEALLEAIKFDPNATPDQEKVRGLCAMSAKFARTWAHNRPDFKDDSPSAYCFSLAAITLNAGWSVQEVVDLIIAFRRTYSMDLKLDRRDWYLLHTILRAENDNNMSAASVTLEEEINAGEDDVLKNLGTMLGLHELGYAIIGFYQHGKQDARFWLEVDTGGGSLDVVPIGSVRELRSVQGLRDLFILHFGMVIPSSVTRARWENILKNLMRVKKIRNEDAGNYRDEVREWVERLCNTWTVPFEDTGDEGWAMALPSRSPFKRKGRIFVSAPKIREMLMREGTRMSIADITQMLGLSGFTREKVGARIEGKVIGTSYWAAPLEDFPGV